MSNMTKSEILGRINACNNELQQKDYTARKVAFELAAAFKEKFPDVSLPAYEQYKAGEETAALRRVEINQLQEQLEEAEDNTNE